jgi:hypothetical protein
MGRRFTLTVSCYKPVAPMGALMIPRSKQVFPIDRKGTNQNRTQIAHQQINRANSGVYLH